MFIANTVIHEGRFGRRQGQALGTSLIEKIGRIPQVCWLFASPGEDLDMFVRGAAEAVSPAILVGCTTDGEISHEGVTTNTAVLSGLYANSIEVEMVSVAHIGRDSWQAGQLLADRFSSDPRYVQLFIDGITGNGSEFLSGLLARIGSLVPVAGGMAGDGGRFRRTWQFVGEKVFTDAAVALGFTGDFHLGTGIASGWSPIGLPKKVTRAEGNILYELNGEPALKVYERFLGKHAEKLPAVGVEYPLAVEIPDAEVKTGMSLFRASMSVKREQGAIKFAGDIPEGATVWLTCGDVASILDAARDAARLALKDLGGADPAMIFCYSCMARKLVLGRHVLEEPMRVQKEIGADIPIVGFYTYGEYCRLKPGGKTMLHNETITLSILGF